MSAQKRNRYITVAAVFLLAFLFLGALIVRSVGVMAQDYTFKPQTATANTYAAGVASTQRLNFAYDQNLSTAASTYTNADFSGDGVTPDVSFEFSGRWSTFQQTTTFLRAVGLYVNRAGVANSLNQWRIQYTLYGAGAADADWVTLEDGSVTANPGKGEITTLIPDDTDLVNDLAVRTMSRQQNAIDAVLAIYDIRVEAEWDEIHGGIHPLQIDTPLLPDGVKDVPYGPEYITASGGNTFSGGAYDWSLVSGTIPTGMSWTPALPTQNATIELSGTPTAGGLYTFTIRVQDNSTPTTQSDQVQYTIRIAGLGIDPPGPDLVDWDPMVVGTGGSQTFVAEGGTPSNYDWCLVSGTIPPGLSWSPSLPSCALAVASTSSIYISGTPTNPGTYSFTIRLADATGAESPVDHHYLATVSSDYVTIIKRLLRPVIKGISYGYGTLQMTPQVLRAVNVVYSTYAGQVNWSSSGLPAGMALQGTTLDTVSASTSVYIGGTIGVSTSAGVYNFTALVDDNSGASDSETFALEVLGRNTLLQKAPPSSVTLPADHTLNFLVSAQGGAPSNTADTQLDGRSIPYYNYAWQVTPAPGSNAPALGTSSGTASGPIPNPPYEPGPLLIGILFEDASVPQPQPVTGTYDVTFWAQDYLRRQNPLDSNYRFAPATVRIQIISSAGQTLEKDSNRPTLLKQEQFR